MAALSIPFTLRRPWLMMSQWFTDRDEPDLDRLRAMADPERFVWAMLPHAARTFASCIALLPSDKARAAAVGYLYCRALDTYEDLAPEPGPLLDAFAERFDGEPRDTGLLGPAPQLQDPKVQDKRDRAHLLLIECIDRVDAVYARLSGKQRESITRCVKEMAAGMRDGSSDVLAYCRTVLGNPVVFALELLLDRRLDADETATAMRVSEMVQLANITRDIEKDLSRGVIYDERLAGTPDEATIREVRTDLLWMALERAPDYRGMLAMLRRPRFRLGRASALLMLLYTSRYYDACARRMGYEGWAAPRSTAGFFVRVFPAAFSHRYAMRSARKVDRAIRGFTRRTRLP